MINCNDPPSVRQKNKMTMLIKHFQLFWHRRIITLSLHQSSVLYKHNYRKVESSGTPTPFIPKVTWSWIRVSSNCHHLTVTATAMIFLYPPKVSVVLNDLLFMFHCEWGHYELIRIDVCAYILKCIKGLIQSTLIFLNTL